MWRAIIASSLVGMTCTSIALPAVLILSDPAILAPLSSRRPSQASRSRSPAYVGAERGRVARAGKGCGLRAPARFVLHRVLGAAAAVATTQLTALATRSRWCSSLCTSSNPSW